MDIKKTKYALVRYSFVACETQLPSNMLETKKACVIQKNHAVSPGFACTARSTTDGHCLRKSSRVGTRTSS